MVFQVKDSCPKCKEKGKKVEVITIKSIVKENYLKELSYFDDFYFCNTSDCNVVYFKLNEIIKSDNLKKQVGIKNYSYPHTICYCFNWTKEKIKMDIDKYGKTNAIDDITNKMNTIGCNCIVNNPSGSCCLKDVKKVISNLV